MKLLRIALFIILFIIDSVLFGGAGRISTMALTALNALVLITSANTGNWIEASKQGLTLLKNVVMIVVNMVIYYIIALILSKIIIRE